MSDGGTFRPGNDHGLILYDFPGSPCARRVRITLLEKRLEWDTETIDLVRLEQRSPEYLRINPNGVVPALAHGDRVIYESNVITEYLDEAFPETPQLYPEDPRERAQVRMWQSAEASMARDYRALFYQRVTGPLLHATRTLPQALDDARLSTEELSDLVWEERVWRLEVLTPDEECQYADRLERWLVHLDRALEGREYLVGDRFSQAEISVYPSVMKLPLLRLRFDSEVLPNVARWIQTLEEYASFPTTLAPGDRELERLAQNGVLEWLGRTLSRPERERSVGERLRLPFTRRRLRRVLEGESAGAPRSAPILEPRVGRIEPRSRPLSPPARLDRAALEAPLRLYDFGPSPASRRIRILLAEKRLEFERVPVDLTRMHHKAPAYLALNPNGELPTLRHGDRALYDSRTIAEYVDLLWSDPDHPRLMPDEAWARARVRMWLALEAGTQREFRPLFWLRVVRPRLLQQELRPEDAEKVVPDGVHPSHVSWLRQSLEGQPRFDSSVELARTIIARKLDVLEAALAESEYLVGESPTLADLAWFTRVEQLPQLGIRLDPDRWSALGEWLDRLRPRWRVATR